MTKNEQIKQSILETKEKRKHQICRSFEMKVDISHLSHAKLEQLEQLFREAKWFYNHLLNLINDKTTKLNKINTSEIKDVLVKRKEEFEQEHLNVLSSQMKQSLQSRISDSLHVLSVLKKKGKKVGWLKFKNEFNFNCIPLKQFGKTYKILNDKYISIEKIKGNIKVSGLKQLKEYFDIADAKLIKKDDDYYIRITCYIDKDMIPEIEYKAFSVGIDFGITTPLALSNKQGIYYSIPTSKRTKKQQKKLKHKTKYSKNWNKTKKKIRKGHNKTNNIKHDITNKVFNVLSHTFKHVIYQDENLKFFQKGFGKQIQNTRLGGIITRLKSLDTSIEVSRYFPSTKLCLCGYKNNDITLSDRIYKCPDCKLILDRDYKSAMKIEDEGLQSNPEILMERKNFKPVEKCSAAIDLKGCFISSPYIKVRALP